jgi:hypothetical protein
VVICLHRACQGSPGWERFLGRGLAHGPANPSPYVGGYKLRPRLSPTGAVSFGPSPERPGTKFPDPFQKLPEPDADRPAKDRWLQTAADIFDLVYKGEGGIVVGLARADRSPRHDEWKKPPTDGVDGPLTTSTCQNGGRRRSPATGAVHERDYNNWAGPGQEHFPSPWHR